MPHCGFKQIRSYPCFLVCTLAYRLTFYMLKTSGFFDFPITSSFLFSVPSALSQRRTGLRSLESLPPTHFCPLNISVLSGVNLKKSVSSALNISVCIPFAHSGPHGIKLFWGSITVDTPLFTALFPEGVVTQLQSVNPTSTAY